MSSVTVEGSMTLSHTKVALLGVTHFCCRSKGLWSQVAVWDMRVWLTLDNNHGLCCCHLRKAGTSEDVGSTQLETKTKHPACHYQLKRG